MTPSSSLFGGGSLYPSWQTRVGKHLLLLHLVLSPLFFCLHTVEAFEGPKALLLTGTAFVLASLAASDGLRRIAVVRPRWKVDLPTLGFLLFTASAAISTLFSLSPLVSWRGASESHAGLQTLLGYLILYLATRRLCRTVEDGRRLLTAVVLGSALSSVYALVQAAHLDPAAWDEAATLANNVRPFSTLGHANYLSAYLVMAAPLLAAFLLGAVALRRWGAALARGLILLLSGAAVIAALSRAGWLAAACALLALCAGWFLAGARRAAGTLASLAVLGVGLVVCWACVGGGGDGLAERFRHMNDGIGRSQIWQASWGLFCDRPLVGCGPDALQLAFGSRRPPDYALVEWDATPTRAHNVALHILATQGLLGAAAAIVLAAGLCWAGIRAFRRAAAQDKPFVVAVAAALVAFLVQDLFGFTVIGCGSLAVTCAALLSRWSAAGGEENSATDKPAVTFGGLCIGGGLAVSLFLINLGWNGVALAALLGAVAALAVWAVWRSEVVCHGSVSRVGSSRTADTAVAHRSSRPRSPWGLLPHLGIGFATAAGLWVLVIQPFAASVVCRAADLGAEGSPGEALAGYENAVSLDANDDQLWVKLGGAAQRAARQATDGAERRRLSGQARAALERAVALVPASPYNHANLGRLLGELAFQGLASEDEAFREWDAALSADPVNVRFLTEAGRTALAVRRFDRARQWAAKGLDVYPNYGPLYAQKGAYDFAEGRLDAAAVELDKSLKVDWRGEEEDKTRAYATFAAVEMGRKQFDQAWIMAHEACGRSPRWAAPCLLEARALQALGRGEEARREYQRLLTLDPENAEARAALRSSARAP
jgi:O-antigen ligase/tetratricopeptide (TPR) repeat protein